MSNSSIALPVPRRLLRVPESIKISLGLDTSIRESSHLASCSVSSLAYDKTGLSSSDEALRRTETHPVERETRLSGDSQGSRASSNF